MPSYNWLTHLAARQQLANRLYDPGNVFWTDAENGVYLKTALRMFNVLTFTWKTDFVFPTTDSIWNSISNLPGSPRQRTLTDVDAYIEMQYHLLEPPTGATWTGTPQFSIADLSRALQARRNEMIKVSNCNQSLMIGIPLTPNTRRTVLANDSVIDVARVRYIPVPAFWSSYGQGGAVPPPWGYGSGGYGEGGYGQYTPPTGLTLYRDDTVAQEWYEPPLYQQESGVPQTFMLTSEPPLSWDVDIPPTYSGTYEAITSLAGRDFNVPIPTLLNIPDDFAWVAQWGALADLLGRESEATDRQRSSYCLKRYADGLNLFLKTPWIMLGKVNGAAVTLDSIANTDRYTPEWDNAPANFGPFMVLGGIDFLAAPTGGGAGAGSVGVTVLGNAPVPVADTDPVQVSRDNWDTVLDLAQMLATFKCGGAEWQASLELETRAIQACAAENARLKSTGAFADILVQRGQAQDRDQNRYNTAASMAQQAKAQ
jgi:hypothetical protein